MKKLAAFLGFVVLLGTLPVRQAPIAPITLRDGRTVFVSSDGVAQVWSKDRRTVMYRKLVPSLLAATTVGGRLALPSKADIIAQVQQAPPRAYRNDEVIVVLRNGGVSASSKALTVPVSSLARVRSGQMIPSYTSDYATNRALAKLGVDRSQHIFQGAYRMHLTGASAREAVVSLAKLSNVSYVSPNWFVASMRTPSIPISRTLSDRARYATPIRRATRSLVTSDVPTNYAVANSAQSMLNAPGVNAIAAYDEISKAFHQLPGQGEIITNVSLGDLDDASVVPVATPPGRSAAPADRGGGGPPEDPCVGVVEANGPTTTLIGGQRYLDWPSLPLIPTYVADASGNLSGSAEVCNSADPVLGEVGLDFSVMAPLPHAQQRPSETGSGFTDLMGIAPGASYRLVVPADPAATIADIDAALLGAAQQQPRPNVITASLGFGFDSEGFPGRYLEEDPLTHAIVSSIVQQDGIVVCISANDGLRPATNAAIGPNGGSAATNLAGSNVTPTNLNDVAFSTTPSFVADSGAIDAGATTLNDIFSAQPQSPQNAAQSWQLTFPVTRYNGTTTFSSGNGTRVNLSAPGDNIVAMQHDLGSNDDVVDSVLEGGTSASAPAVAAAAAVVLQVARLTRAPFQNASSVRAFLEQTADPVPNTPESNETLNVGPQIDLTNAVETLLSRAGMAATPSVTRIAVVQRRNAGVFDGAFTSDTDPTAIDLQGPLDANNVPTGNNRLAWLTIAPDWEGLSSSARFSLNVTNAQGKQIPIGTHRWTRILPSAIFQAAGLAPTSTANRNVTLTYVAQDRGRTISASVTLTFGPTNGTSTSALAPIVQSVSRVLTVTYDLTGVRNVSSPLIIVSEPGRINPSTGFLFNVAFAMRVPTLKGTVNLPISELQGDGIYGIAIGLRTEPSGAIDVSDFAYTHVLQARNDVDTNAPLLSSAGSAPSHTLEIPYNGSFTVSWDVSNVPSATAAKLEISAPGPTGGNVLNPFNNPGGTIRDANGFDNGSVYFTSVFGRSGSITLNGRTAGLVPTMNHVVRVIPMSGTTPVGEAGAVSTITMDGIAPADGGILENGYAIDPNGTAGFLTSAQITNAGQFLSSAETFDQTTAAVNTATSSSNDLYFTTGSGLWTKSMGILGIEDLSIAGAPANAYTYQLMNSSSATPLGAAWNPPVLSDGVSEIVQTAPNFANDSALTLSGDAIGSATIPYKVFTSNLVANTFGTAFDLTSVVPSGGGAFAVGLAQNTTTNTGVVGFANFNESCGPPAIATVNLASGAISSFAGKGQGFPLDDAIDSTTNQLIYQTSCDMTLNVINLSTHNGVSVPLPGDSGLYNAVDPVHGLIAVEMASAPGGGNNEMSGIFIYDEHGNLLKTLDQFNFYNTGLLVNANNLQLNPNHRTGYMFGPNAYQLQPFTY